VRTCRGYKADGLLGAAVTHAGGAVGPQLCIRFGSYVSHNGQHNGMNKIIFIRLLSY